jgi:hypothetical protein
MCKSIRILFCFFFMGFALSGCLGFVTLTPGECKNETPNIFARRYFRIWNKQIPLTVSSKTEFLQTWGQT